MSHWREDKAKEVTRKSPIAGNDIKGWQEYAKGNSYRPHRQQLRHDIGFGGCKEDYEQGIPDLPRQKRAEGRGYVFTNDLAPKNTYTGGSKRD